MAENTFKLFGFEITRTKDKKALASPVPPRDDDGAGYVTATSAGSHYGHYINMEGDDSKDNAQLILKYRGSLRLMRRLKTLSMKQLQQVS